MHEPSDRWCGQHASFVCCWPRITVGMRRGCRSRSCRSLTSDSMPRLFAADRSSLEFNRDVRPILAENCFACHGPDSAARKADLRLDRRDEAIKAGAITPGDTEGSELLARINANDPKELMPPPVTTKKLTPEQKDVLRRWIADGAALSTALVAHPAQAARAAGRARHRVGPRADRPLRAGEARSAAACAPPPKPTAERWRGGWPST